MNCRKHFIFSILFLFALSGYGQLITIEEARSLPEGSDVTVRGIALNGPELGSIRYIQDNTGAIAVYDFSLLTDIVAGDSIEVSGELYDYNSLLEISPITSVSVINTGNPVPAPEVVTLTSGWDESWEARLVTVNDVTFTDSGTFSTAGSGTNYDVTDGSSTGEIRVYTSTNIDGTAIPEEEVNITGIMSQYAPGGSGGYQLLPRDLSDISTGGNPPVISSMLTQSNITTTSFTVSFSTLYDGNTIVAYGTNMDDLSSTVEDASLSTTHNIDLTGLQDGTIYYVQGISVSITNDTSRSPVTAMATMSNSTGEIRTWFNNPVDNSVSSGVNAQYNPNFVDTIIWYIDHAQYSLDLAIYNIDNDNNIINALNDAYLRGVNVRVIADDGVNGTAWSTLSIGSGKKIKSPTGETPDGGFYGIMHNKFMVIDAVSVDPDDAWVITGSTNMTDAQLKVDPQNMIAIQDQSLARAYTIEFNEMFDGTFGPLKSNNTPHEFIIDGKRVELYFSPSDDTESYLKMVIQEADYDLYFAIFSYTRYSISYEIEDAIDAGVFVAGIWDQTDASNTLAIDILEDAMSETLFQASGPGIFHHKYMIADPFCPQSDPVVFTGSHNWSTSAQVRNDENTLIIHDSTLANIYYQEFAQRYSEEGGTIVVDGYCDFVNTEEITSIQNIGVYPNPATSQIVIMAESLYVPGNTTYALKDISGRTIISGNLNNESSLVNLSDIPSGFYLVEVWNGKESAVSKLILQD